MDLCLHELDVDSQTAQILDSSNTSAWQLSTSATKRAESCDCETHGRDSGLADRAREDFARCVSRKLGESQSKDAKTDDLQSGWHSKCWRGAFLHSWMFASALSLRWLVFNAATAQTAPSLSAIERRRFVIPIWAVSA